MKFRIIFTLASMLALAACVTVKPKAIDAAAAAALDGKTFATTTYELPDFSAMTAGKVQFGLVGGLAMISAGNEIVRENAIPDPAIAINDALAARLVPAHRMQRVDAAGVVDGEKPAELLATYPAGDYLVDVRTVNWSFVYYPTDWSHYRVIYSARMRLLDRATGKFVAESICSSTQGNDADPPSRDELLADNAALLKQYLASAGTACSETFARDFLAL